MITRLLHLAVTRRWLMMAMTLGLCIIGVLAYQRLPVDAVPDITNVQVMIATRAPGYSPLETERRVTFPIETALGGLPGLSQTRSISKYGLSQVTAVFADGTDLYFARQQVNQRLQEVRGSLPGGIEPTLGPVATGLGEIFMYALTADADARQADGSPYDATALRSIQDWIIRPQLRQTAGVTEVDSIGGVVKQYHVLPDPTMLLAHRLKLDDVVMALEENNASRGAGYIERNGEQLLVRTTGELRSIDDIRNVVIATVDGTPVRIADVGEVKIGGPLRTGAAQLGTEETVLSTAFMLIGENSRIVSRRVAEKLDEIRQQLPEGVRALTVYNRTDLVEKTVGTVQKNLIEGAVLVVVVLFLMLGNLRAALLTALVIPVSLLMTFTGMVGANVSGNLMSLGALDFGLIVDGSVIIVENCILRLGAEQHRVSSPLSLAHRLSIVHEATAEVFRPSLVSVLVVVLVNLPIFALTGVEGKMFHPMALTVVMALLAALFLSVTMVPALIAILLRGPISEKENLIVHSAKRIYAPALAWSLRRPTPILTGAVVLVLICGVMATRLGTEFIPNLDEGDLIIQPTRVPGVGIEQAVTEQVRVNAALMNVPEVARVFARTGTNEAATDPMSPGETDTFVMIKPRHEWPDPAKPKAQLIEELAATVDAVPGASYGFTQPIQMRFNELISGVRADLAIKIFGDDLDTLERVARRVAAEITAVPGAADVKVEQASGLPMLAVEPDRERLARYGVNVAEVQDLVAVAIGGQPAGQIFEGDARYDVVVRLPESQRTDPSALARLPLLLNGSGGYIPLSEVARVERTLGPNQISRENGKRRIVVTANVRGRDLGGFVGEAQTRVASAVVLPPAYYMTWGGTFEQLTSAAQRLTIVVPIALLMIFGLLYLTFASVKDALLVFSGVPLALTGGILALWLRDIPLSISAGVGFITLSGVAVLSGVVLVSMFRELLSQNSALIDAVTEGSLTRLRPILMIGLVASLGFLPMALNTGTGAEVQRPLATVVIGGILSATLLSLLVLPTLFAAVHRKDSD
ncbi:CusA/CzcA family heavy metal efflux RND transporter [Sinimarinibacterium sp. CAU 1509]|uniref:efflux RND transporter permease subunit n=1 Tax=Sinimarinibacterium sp. CAU 1509 TaxID=2562283 RepID=UPI0010AB97DB|nr:CusA/CzcA family heavy metal efflux RND transporter [Sinimarinibacterium sp. CAU 1509]TJY62040.1 CusA/CzcA family heavy metal efflux RND transporter [Sinimarinibacterium sp. CAU 1509]